MEDTRTLFYFILFKKEKKKGLQEKKKTQPIPNNIGCVKI